jgi:anhydro-N-acetylmuramic acid kinase
VTELCIGLISGTSQDSIDAALVEFDQGRFKRLLARHSRPYPAALRARLVALSHESELVSLADLTDLDRQVGEQFALATEALIREAGCVLGDVAAIGSHGQTVFHDADRVRSTLQLGDPGLIAVRTGIPVVGDFRRADMALGGQGAPLMPAFHHALFADAKEARAVLNLGGIANLSLLPDADPAHVIGFDSGPASCLMDEWTERHLRQPFDRDGAWAATGRLDDDGLRRSLSDPYFKRAAPKSTGRGYFHLDWLAARWPAHVVAAPADVQRTLCELTAISISEDLRRHAPGTRRLLVCGGGAHNTFLMARLAALLGNVSVASTAGFGLDPQWIEASGFAWLAMRRLRGEAGNLPSVTGAVRAAPLGGLYLP